VYSTVFGSFGFLVVVLCLLVDKVKYGKAIEFDILFPIIPVVVMSYLGGVVAWLRYRHSAVLFWKDRVLCNNPWVDISFSKEFPLVIEEKSKCWILQSSKNDVEKSKRLKINKKLYTALAGDLQKIKKGELEIPCRFE
jgi:hypothetical protein